MFPVKTEIRSYVTYIHGPILKNLGHKHIISPDFIFLPKI